MHVFSQCFESSQLFASCQIDLLKEFYVNCLIEYNVINPVSKSYSSYLDSLASFFCGSAGYSEFACLQKNVWHLDIHYYYIKLDEFPHRMLAMV